MVPSLRSWGGNLQLIRSALPFEATFFDAEKKTTPV
jgi:hypothetical protein